MDGGALVVGETTKFGIVGQTPPPLDADKRLIEYVKGECGENLQYGGYSLSAGQLLEKFGFLRQRHFTPLGKLSGGERKRLQASVKFGVC